MEIKVNIDNRGRIPLPLNIRKELDISNGDTVVLRVINGELKILSMPNLIKEIQNSFAKYKKDNISMVDEFIEMKREEATLENKQN